MHSGNSRSLTSSHFHERYFEFDVTTHVSFTQPNFLEVQVTRPHDRVFPPDNNDTDLSISFIDWSPHPPDGSMGIWRDVLVSSIFLSGLM